MILIKGLSNGDSYIGYDFFGDGSFHNIDKNGNEKRICKFYTY